MGQAGSTWVRSHWSEQTGEFDCGRQDEGYGKIMACGRHTEPGGDLESLVVAGHVLDDDGRRGDWRRDGRWQADCA